jgi:hypothetical protein
VPGQQAQDAALLWCPDGQAPNWHVITHAAYACVGNRRPGADMDAQRWQPRDGAAAAAVPSDVAELPSLPAPPVAAICLCGQTRVEACALPL